MIRQEGPRGGVVRVVPEQAEGDRGADPRAPGEAEPDEGADVINTRAELLASIPGLPIKHLERLPDAGVGFVKAVELARFEKVSEPLMTQACKMRR